MTSPQREAYQLPGQRDSGAGAQQQSTTGYTPSYGVAPETDRAPVTYICGECAAKVALTLGDAIRCKDCGHRVLYKQRTKKLVQFEAK